jgi:GMP synthase (glutamine-hydrolysing)
MTRTALVLQHAAPEGPGGIGDALRRADVATRIIHVYRGEPVPASLDADALVVMGGPMGVYEADQYPHLRDELRLIESALQQGRPLIGICLGSQLIAAALGARVYPSGRKELGWYPVTLTEAAATDALLGDAPRQFVALHWHGDIFDLPAGAVHLASSQMTAHQAFRYAENAYALLFHMEVTPPHLDAMMTAFADEIAEAGVSSESMHADAAQHLATLQALGATVFDRFARSVATDIG